MYSENSRPELGRVYIFLNNEVRNTVIYIYIYINKMIINYEYLMYSLIFIVQGVFEKNTVIIGTAVSGRFGISVEGLGDINNDGYEGT